MAISVICGTITVAITLKLVYEMCTGIKNAKTNAQKKKTVMFNLSAWLVFCIFLLASINLGFCIGTTFYSVGDCLMDIIIVVAIYLNFRQWGKNVSVYIDKRFLQPLRLSSYKDRHIFETRIETLASNVLTICEDENAAILLVKQARILKSKAFDNKLAPLLNQAPD